jgi:hypothetical protein
MTGSLTAILSVIILALVLVELLVIRELTSNGRQSARLRVPVQIQERLPKGRRFLCHPVQPSYRNSQKEKPL